MKVLKFKRLPKLTALKRIRRPLPVASIAWQCRCTPPVIFSRLRLLRQRLDLDPAKLGRYSSHLEKIASSLSPPGVKGVYRKGAAYGQGRSDD